MKKKVLVLGFVIVGCLALCACLPKKADDQSQTNQGEEKAISFKNLQELIDSNAALHCTWNYSEDGISASGELYGKGKKFYQSATYDEGGDEMEILSVSDGEWMYMWDTAQKTAGSKIEMDKLDELNEKVESDGGGQKMVSMEKDINLVCYSWSVDNSKFVPPTDIEFMDLTPMIMQANEMMNSGSMCASCNYLPAGDQRDECLKALNCQ